MEKCWIVFFGIDRRGIFCWAFISYTRKMFRKTNISYPLTRTRTRAYQWVINNIFSENLY